MSKIQYKAQIQLNDCVEYIFLENNKSYLNIFHASKIDDLKYNGNNS